MTNMSNTQRLNIQAVDKKAYQPLVEMEKYIHSGSLGEDLLALIKLRASQLNGCAYCLNMHAGEARKAQVDQVKVDVLAGWHEAASVYSDREQAALRLTEEVTRITDGVSDDTWAAASAVFSEQEMVELLMAVSAINVWNRLAVATHQHLD
jgi:AhpD family alkylhydroperoxidase